MGGCQVNQTTIGRPLRTLTRRVPATGFPGTFTFVLRVTDAGVWQVDVSYPDPAIGSLITTGHPSQASALAGLDRAAHALITGALQVPPPRPPADDPQWIAYLAAQRDASCSAGRTRRMGVAA